MTTTQRRIIITVIVALNIFNASVIYKLWWQEIKRVQKVKESSVQSPNPHARKILDTVQVAEASDSVRQQVFMKILGNSYKLSAAVMQNLRAYRKKQRILLMNYPGDVFFNGDTTRKEVALTFDDGPDNKVTLQVLQVLNKYKVKASFFVVGDYVRKYPEVARQIDEQGHLVLNHSNSHKSYMKKSKQWVQQDLLKAEEAVFEAIGKRPTMFRPPYGDVDTVMIAEVKSNRYKNIIWSYDTLDWTGMVKDSIAHGVKTWVRPGEIILMHSRQGTEPTAQALPQIIEYLQKQGYKIVRLDKMLKVPAYKE